jgi:diamine N-acetyltransferase
MRIQYSEIPQEQLDLIAPLWEKLRKHQEVRSPNFASHFAKRNWSVRKAQLLERGSGGAIHIDVARDMDSDIVVAYCVATISSDSKGTIESVYAEPEHRGKGIGDHLMREALRWFEERHASPLVLDVGVGNEEVLSFYSRYSFYPRTIVLQRTQ